MRKQRANVLTWGRDFVLYLEAGLCRPRDVNVAERDLSSRAIAVNFVTVPDGNAFVAVATMAADVASIHTIRSHAFDLNVRDADVYRRASSKPTWADRYPRPRVLSNNQVLQANVLQSVADAGR